VFREIIPPYWYNLSKAEWADAAIPFASYMEEIFYYDLGQELHLGDIL
jgi:hypothetical protein